MTDSFFQKSYTVTFVPGRYKIDKTKMKAPDGSPIYTVGREDDGRVIGFFFEIDSAKQVCFALNIADAHLRGDTIDRNALLREFEKLKDVH